MGDFTKVSFHDVDDVAKLRGRDDFEARMARGLLGTSEVGVSLFRYDPGMRHPFGHRHGVQEEVYVVVEGSGRMKLDDEVIDLAPWDVVRVAPPVARGVEAGPEGITLIVAGGRRPEEGDGEIIEGFWD